MNTRKVTTITVALVLTPALFQTNAEERSRPGDLKLSDADVENIVRRSYQYVAMYNVNNKFAHAQGGVEHHGS